MFKLKINYLLIVVISLSGFFSVLIFNSLESFEDIFSGNIIYLTEFKKSEKSNVEPNKLSTELNTNNPLDNYWGEASKIYYWDFAEDNADYPKRLSGLENNNFYIKSLPYGGDQYISVGVFRNDQLIFEEDIIFKGRAFMDLDGYLNIIKGDLNDNDPTCYPNQWLLEKYKYNSDKNTMDKIETRIYSGGERRELIDEEKGTAALIIYPYTNYPDELLKFEKDNSIE